MKRSIVHFRSILPKEEQVEHAGKAHRHVPGRGPRRPA